MMKRIRFFLILSLIFFCQRGIFGQQVEQVVIAGRVLTEEGDPVKGVVVLVPGAGKVQTLESGVYRIQLPAGVVSGESITLEIDYPGWVIKSPVQGTSYGKINVPLKTISQPIDIIIVRKGSLSLWTEARIRAFLEEAKKEAKSKGEIKEKERQSMFELLLSEQADYLDLDVSDLKDGIEEWISKAKTPLEKDLAAYYLSNFTQAKQLIDQSLDREKNTAIYLKYLKSTGDVLCVNGDTAGALEVHKRALDILKKEHGEVHPDVALSLNCIGRVLRVQRDYAGALEHYRLALDIFKKVHGEEHRDVALSLNYIGEVLHIQRDYVGALEHYRLALDTFKKVHGEEHPDVALSLNYIGEVLRIQRDYAGALKHHMRALDIFKKVHGEEHLSVAQCLGYIGPVYRDQKDPQKALEYYFQAVKILRKNLGNDHPHTKAVQRIVEDLKKELGLK